MRSSSVLSWVLEQTWVLDFSLSGTWSHPMWLCPTSTSKPSSISIKHLQ